MIVLGWLLSPLVTLLALLHTALSSIVGLVAMGVNPSGGDWMMWNVGRRLWSRPMLRWVVGAKLDIDIHPEAQALADAGKGVVLVANHASLIDINAASQFEDALPGFCQELVGSSFGCKRSADKNPNGIVRWPEHPCVGRQTIVSA